MIKASRWLLTIGLALCCGAACSDDTTTAADSGVKADGAVDAAVADMARSEAGKDAAKPDIAAADAGKPDAAILTPGWGLYGGSKTDNVVANEHDGVAVASQGNTYISGSFNSDLSLGTFSLTSTSIDGYVAKLSPAGKVLWATQIGDSVGTAIQRVSGLCLDANGTPYVVGYYIKTITLGSKTTTNAGTYPDYFVAAVSATDGKVTWSQAAAGAAGANASLLDSCTFDSAGKLWVGGAVVGSYTLGSTKITTAAKDQDALLMRYSADRSKIELATAFGGTGTQDLNVVALGPKGNVYAAGVFKTAFKAGSTTATAVDDWDIFVAKLTSAGAVTWAVTGGGKSGDSLHALVVDKNGDAYVGGHIGNQFNGSASFKIGSKSLTIGTWAEGLLAKITSSGTVSWAKEVHGTNSTGGGAEDKLHGLALDASGRLIVTGTVAFAFNFFGQKVKAPNPTTGFGAVLGRVTTSGDAQWAVAYGDSPFKYYTGWSVAVDSKGDIVMMGTYRDQITLGGKTFVSKGKRDLFVHKVTPPK